jgi:hypothetical protein
VLPGRPPAPLTDNEPGPEHGRPVRGFVPVVVLVSTPPSWWEALEKPDFRNAAAGACCLRSVSD